MNDTTDLQARIARLERANEELVRQLRDMSNAVHVAIDALTYIASAVSRIEWMERQEASQTDVELE